MGRPSWYAVTVSKWSSKVSALLDAVYHAVGVPPKATGGLLVAVFFVASSGLTHVVRGAIESITGTDRHYLVDDSGTPIRRGNGDSIQLPSDCETLSTRQDTVRTAALARMDGITITGAPEASTVVRQNLGTLFDRAVVVASAAERACQESKRNGLSRLSAEPLAARAKWDVIFAAESAAQAIPRIELTSPDPFATADSLGLALASNLRLALQNECKRPDPHQPGGFVVTEDGDPLRDVLILLERGGDKSWEQTDADGCYKFQVGFRGVYRASVAGPLRPSRIRTRRVISVFYDMSLRLTPGEIKTVHVPWRVIVYDSLSR